MMAQPDWDDSQYVDEIDQLVLSRQTDYCLPSIAVDEANDLRPGADTEVVISGNSKSVVSGMNVSARPLQNENATFQPSSMNTLPENGLDNSIGQDISVQPSSLHMSAQMAEGSSFHSSIDQSQSVQPNSIHMPSHIAPPGSSGFQNSIDQNHSFQPSSTHILSYMAPPEGSGFHSSIGQKYSVQPSSIHMPLQKAPRKAPTMGISNSFTDRSGIKTVYLPIMTSHQDLNESTTLDQGHRQGLSTEENKQDNQIRYERQACYAGAAYQRAIKKGECAANQFKLVMLGPHGAGKTSTVNSLLGKGFRQDQPSTVGADISYVLTSDTVDCIYTCDWEVNEFHEYMEELTTHCSHKLKQKMKEILEKTQNLSENTAYDSAGLKVLRNEAIPKGSTRIIIYDLGGQEVYYDIQFLFLASHDVIFLTFNASIGLDEFLVTQQFYEKFQEDYKIGKKQTNFQAIETTLHAVYSFCGEKCDNTISPRIPTVIMVATHASGLTEQKKEEITCVLFGRLVNTPLIDHFPKKDIIDPIYFIDNKEMEPETLKKLKFVAILAADFAITKKQPIPYLKFEQEILKMSQKVPKINKSDASRIAEDAGVEVEEESLKELLHHYFCKGVLLHYPDAQTLNHLVFISPQMVSNLVSFVIKTHDYAKFGDTCDLRKKFIRFDKFGILEEALLDDMLDKSRDFNYTDKEMILDFLITFQLAVEVDRETKFESEEVSYSTPDSGRVFVVPSVLAYNKSKDHLKPENHVENVVLYHFPDKFSVFNYVLTSIIQWCKNEGHSICRIHHGIGVFDFSNEKQCFTLQHCPKTHSIKCYICVRKQEVNNPSLSKQRLKLLGVLKNQIDEAHAHCLSKAQKAIAYVECPFQHDEKCGPPHLPLDKVKPSMYCKVVHPKKQVPEEAYNLVLPFDQSDEYQKPTKVECAISLCPVSEREKRPSLKELGRRVINQYAEHWDCIGIELGVRIADIEKDYHESTVAITNVIRARNNLEPVDKIYGPKQQQIPLNRGDSHSGNIGNTVAPFNYVPGRPVDRLPHMKETLPFSLPPVVNDPDQKKLPFVKSSRKPIPAQSIQQQQQQPWQQQGAMYQPAPPPQPLPAPAANPPDVPNVKQANHVFTLLGDDATPIKSIRSHNKLFVQLAFEMTAEWERLGRLLNVSEPDIYAIKMDNIHSVTKQAVQMFRQWLMKHGPEATVGSLITAVYESGPQNWNLLNTITNYVGKTMH